jgi:oxaloacetate decarboxylase alpha subunit
VDSRILVAQVPGGMLTNLENQLREQNASDRLDEVLDEIPRVREDLGFIPLVTPTSQIVGTQAVINVLMNDRYKNITKETAGVLKGEYGATPAPVNEDLQARVLDGEAPITGRPADNLQPEVDALTGELQELAAERGFSLASDVVDDVLTYALFPQVGLKFLENRGNPDAFEPAPGSEEQPTVELAEAPAPSAPPRASTYNVRVNGRQFTVEVSEAGTVSAVKPAEQAARAPVRTGAGTVAAALAGNVFKVLVQPGDVVTEGQTILVVEAMKMETAVAAPQDGTVADVHVREGDAVAVGDPLVTLA